MRHHARQLDAILGVLGEDLGELERADADLGANRGKSTSDGPSTVLGSAATGEGGGRAVTPTVPFKSERADAYQGVKKDRV